ncbi:TetR family transcriptional regulator C-terminal domain-containing protein [Streptomyces sp. NBC_01511]|uniref:TetR family transcriptional regulator C-terminal domain-containing protein n=1 Tax=Streptomyces sp. NBC_01511 TaxID=2903889 RepID=UPI003867D5C3
MTVATGSPASTGASSEIQRRNEGRVETRVATGVTTGPPSVRATLLALLPVDERSRTEALVANAFLLRSLKDPEIAERFRAGHAQLRDLLASVIASARAAGEFAADLDPVREADLLLALVGGLGDEGLLGHLTAEEVTALIDHQLSRLAAG